MILKIICSDEIFFGHSNFDLVLGGKRQPQAVHTTIVRFVITIDEIVQQFLLDEFELLPIEPKYIFAYQSIPFYDDHRDPFDRFLLATALS